MDKSRLLITIAILILGIAGLFTTNKSIPIFLIIIGLLSFLVMYTDGKTK